MKSQLVLLVTALCMAVVTPSKAQTLNWGGYFGDVLTNSYGDLLDESFVFELGAFSPGFVPSEQDPSLWMSSWMMFDTADFNVADGYFTGEEVIQNGVTSGNPLASTESFAGLEAYLWIRNSDEAVPGSEWLLVRSELWTFPLTGGDCCNTDVIEWAISDLNTGDTPEWGRQGGEQGQGSYTIDTTATSNLQTFTFVPEPSSAMLAAIACLGMTLHRRRGV